MKIARSGGAPISISRRRRGGIEIIQGTSYIKLDQCEIPELVRALNDMTSDAQEGKRMTTSEYQY